MERITPTYTRDPTKSLSENSKGQEERCKIQVVKDKFFMLFMPDGTKIPCQVECVVNKLFAQTTENRPLAIVTITVVAEVADTNLDMNPENDQSREVLRGLGVIDLVTHASEWQRTDRLNRPHCCEQNRQSIT